MAKHFNAGNVWGRVIDVKRGNSRKGVPFAWIRIDCSGEHGSFYVFGRMWGAERIDPLLARMKSHPGDSLRFRGFFEQYTRKVDYWNFTFYSWEPAPGKPHRAAFVLRGVTTGREVEDSGEGKVSMHLTRSGKSGYADVEEDIDFFVRDRQQFELVGVGQEWEAKGYIQQGGGEDEFGLAGGLIRPYAVVLKRVDTGASDE